MLARFQTIGMYESPATMKLENRLLKKLKIHPSFGPAIYYSYLLERLSTYQRYIKLCCSTTLLVRTIAKYGTNMGVQQLNK